MRVPAAAVVASLGLAALLSGCGFTPLYGDAGAGGSLSRIAVTTSRTATSRPGCSDEGWT